MAEVSPAMAVVLAAAFHVLAVVLEAASLALVEDLAEALAEECLLMAEDLAEASHVSAEALEASEALEEECPVTEAVSVDSIQYRQ